jgi:hypothetical protein
MSNLETIQKIQGLIEESNVNEGDYLKMSKFLMESYNKENPDSQIVQPPTKFRNELIEFFKKSNLGPKPDGKGRLQDLRVMKIFFEYGIANLTFLVSLLNVWGYQNKISNNRYDKVVLDNNAREYLFEAIEALKVKKTKLLEQSRESGNTVSITACEKDLEDFENGVIKNKDYLTLVVRYGIAFEEANITLEHQAAYYDNIQAMIDVTRLVNSNYKNQINDLIRATA